jgi:transposase-like protein
MANVGRPTDYTKELGDAFCVRVADDEGVAAICRDEGMPSRTTIYKWLREHTEFAHNYARARNDQGHTVADEMREVRRKVEDGTLDPAAARVIMDSLKWEAGKRNPKSYGEKVALIGGDEGDAPIKVVQRRIVDAS